MDVLLFRTFTIVTASPTVSHEVLAKHERTVTPIRYTIDLSHHTIYQATIFLPTLVLNHTFSTLYYELITANLEYICKHVVVQIVSTEWLKNYWRNRVCTGR